MTTEPTPTIATLTAKRTRLERTHADLTERSGAAAAELERVNGLEPTPENVTRYVEAQRVHLDLATALSNTERLISESDVALERAAQAERRAEQLVEMVETVRLIEQNRQDFSDRLERIGTFLKTELSECLEHRTIHAQLLRQLDPLVYALAPGFQSHRSYFDVDREQIDKANEFATWLKEQRGADLKVAFEGHENYPEPFGASLHNLLEVWGRHGDLETRRKERE